VVARPPVLGTGEGPASRRKDRSRERRSARRFPAREQANRSVGYPGVFGPARSPSRVSSTARSSSSSPSIEQHCFPGISRVREAPGTPQSVQQLAVTNPARTYPCLSTLTYSGAPILENPANPSEQGPNAPKTLGIARAASPPFGGVCVLVGCKTFAASRETFAKRLQREPARQCPNEPRTIAQLSHLSACAAGWRKCHGGKRISRTTKGHGSPTSTVGQPGLCPAGVPSERPAQRYRRWRRRAGIGVAERDSSSLKGAPCR